SLRKDEATDFLIHPQFWRYRLWFDYLRISPSYWLAHKVRTRHVAASSIQLPPNFETFFQTYHLFCYLYNHPFTTWWRSRSSSVFGMGANPGVKRLADWDNLSSLRQKDWKRLDAITRDWVQQTLAEKRDTNCTILFVPLSLNQTVLIKQIRWQLQN